MTVTINGTTINALECKEVFDYGSHALVITIDKAEIDSTALNTLIFSETGEVIAGDIIEERDNGETKAYIGFTKNADISIQASVYVISLYSIASLEQKVAELETTVAEKDTKIAELTEFIETEVDNAITEGVNEA